MKSYLKHYFDGGWVESEGGTRHDAIDPPTEQASSEIMQVEGRFGQGGGGGRALFGGLQAIGQRREGGKYGLTDLWN